MTLGVFSPRYATFIVKHPYILLSLISVLVILSGCFSLIPQLGAPPLPDFDEPVKVCLHVSFTSDFSIKRGHELIDVQSHGVCSTLLIAI